MQNIVIILKKNVNITFEIVFIVINFHCYAEQSEPYSEQNVI